MYIYVPSKHVCLSVITKIHYLSFTCSEALVRTGFQNLQLVMADFLPALPPSCVPVCVEVGGQYGLQKMDINISLTSVGLLVRMT